jgi:hypothetical protein
LNRPFESLICPLICPSSAGTATTVGRKTESPTALLALVLAASSAGATGNGKAKHPLSLDKAVVACAQWVKTHDDPGFDAYLLHGEERVRLMGSERGKFVMDKCLNSHGHQFGPTVEAPTPPPAQLSSRPPHAQAAVPTRLLCLPGYDKAGNQVTRQVGLAPSR